MRTFGYPDRKGRKKSEKKESKKELILEHYFIPNTKSIIGLFFLNVKYETGILKENVREYLLTLVQKFAQINTKALFTKRRN